LKIETCWAEEEAEGEEEPQDRRDRGQGLDPDRGRDRGLGGEERGVPQVPGILREGREVLQEVREVPAVAEVLNSSLTVVEVRQGLMMSCDVLPLPPTLLRPPRLLPKVNTRYYLRCLPLQQINT
jgi:hypothetical protein